MPKWIFQKISGDQQGVRVLYFVGVVYLTPFRINMLILTIFSMTSSLRSMEKPNSNDLVRVSSWTYNHWHLTGNPILAEEVFSRQKKSGEKMANLMTPFFAISNYCLSQRHPLG